MSADLIPPPSCTGTSTDDAISDAMPRFTGSPRPGPVQIGDVESSRPLLDPPRRYGDRVVAEDRLAGVIALIQANALTPSDVYRGYDFHDVTRF